MRRVLLIGMLLILSGCRHKDLWMGGEQYATLEVVFDWADTRTRAEAEEPLTMSLYLYPENGNPPLYYELSGHSGGRVRVPFGRYTAVAWNHENTAILFRGQNSPETLEAYTREEPVLASMGLTTRAPRPETLETERSVLEPGPFWTGCKRGLEVSMAAPLQVTVPIRDAYGRLSVRVSQVENIRFLGSVSFAISSVSASCFPVSGALGKEDVTIPFGGNVVDGEYLEGRCTLFGHCPREPHGHWLTIYAILSDGSKYFTHVDVTGQMHRPGEDPEEMDLEIEGIAFPDPFDGDASAFASVDDWLTEKIDLIMH